MQVDYEELWHKLKARIESTYRLMVKYNDPESQASVYREILTTMILDEEKAEQEGENSNDRT